MIDHDPPANALDDLFRSQLRAFIAGLDETPMPKAQDLRGATLAFIAAFAPDTLSATSCKWLTDTRAQIRARSDCAVNGWWRIPFLDVAQFHLSGNTDDVAVIFQNLSHHNSVLRSGLFAPLALTLPKLDLQRTEFAHKMAQNFESWHFYNDQGVCLLMASSMPKQAKIEILQDWSRLDISPQD